MNFPKKDILIVFYLSVEILLAYLIASKLIDLPELTPILGVAFVYFGKKIVKKINE